MTDKQKLQIEIGKRIKFLRESKGISQQDIAGLCNIEKSNFSRLEAGGTNPTIFTLSKIAEHLNVPLKELVDIELSN